MMENKMETANYLGASKSCRPPISEDFEEYIWLSTDFMFRIQVVSARRALTLVLIKTQNPKP